MQQLQLTQRQYLIQQGLNLPGMVMPGGDRGDRGDRERDRVGAERGKMLSHYFFLLLPSTNFKSNVKNLPNMRVAEYYLKEVFHTKEIKCLNDKLKWE